MHDHTLHSGRKHIFCYSLEVFSTVDCFKTSGKQMIKMPQSKKMLEPKVIKGKQNLRL